MSDFSQERHEFESCLKRAQQGDQASVEQFWAEYAPLAEIAARRNLRRRAGAHPPHVEPSPGFVTRLLMRTIGNLLRPRPDTLRPGASPTIA
jgi:hypothetical protein